MRTKLVALIPIVFAGCVDDSLATSSQPVIGGELTPAGRYPATGALLAEVYGQRHVFCTGTLIAPDVVLTAAHCLLPAPQIGDFMPSFTLALDANAAPSSQVFAGREKHRHPLFDPSTAAPGTLSRAYDIGVVILEHPVPGAMPAYLPTTAEAAAVMVNAPFEITGYGQTSATAQTIGVKYDATTTLMAIGDYELQVGAAGMPQNCHGDSGGPGYIHVGSQLRLFGIVSRGLTGGEDTCDRGGIDTRADAYREWINTYATLGDPPTDPAPEMPDAGVTMPPAPDDDPATPGASASGCDVSGQDSLAPVLLSIGFAAFRRRRR